MVNYAVVGFCVVVYIAVSLALTLPEPPLGPLMVGGVAVVVVPALAFFPFAKTIWSAIDLVLHGFRFEEDER